MQLLIIKLNALHSNPEYALLGKKQSEDNYTPGDWDKVRSLAKGRRVVLLLPNSDVVLTSVSIPSKNKKQLHQAIPYALEDTLAEDIEKLHFAIHQDATTAESFVAIINRERLDLVNTLLRKKSITAHFILPQILAQSCPDKAWSVVQQTMDFNGNQPVTVRLNTFNGFSCDKNLLDLFLTEQLDKNTPEAITSNIDVEELPEALQELPVTMADPSMVQYSSIEQALPLNLLTGYVSHKRKSNFNWKAWRPPLIIASLVGATWLGTLGWQNSQLQQQKKQLNLSIENIFKSTFPDSRLVDAPQQMGSKLAQLKKGMTQTIDSPLPLISDISPLLKQYKDLSLKEIRYKDNELILVIEAPSLTRLENFKKEATEKSKLKISIKSSTTTADKVESLLLIEPLAQLEIDTAGDNT